MRDDLQKLIDSVKQLSTQLASTDLSLRAETAARPVFVTPLPGKSFRAAIMTDTTPTGGPAAGGLMTQLDLTEASRTQGALLASMSAELQKVGDNADSNSLNIQVLLADVEDSLNEALDNTASKLALSQLDAKLAQQHQETLAAIARSTTAVVVLKPTTPAEIQAALAPTARLGSVEQHGLDWFNSPAVKALWPNDVLFDAGLQDLIKKMVNGKQTTTAQTTTVTLDWLYFSHIPLASAMSMPAPVICFSVIL